MLNVSDVMVSGGSNTLYGCWTTPVTKFDGSSFYNWEQDNLPILDLEERTHLLWEKFGHPTSSITGMAFVVSSDAAVSCNPVYFQTLSACIDRLPEVINYPILIEVMSFGNLGELDFSNKSFGERGSIEIINRNYGICHPATNTLVLNSESSRTDSPYGLASSISIQDSQITNYASLGSTFFNQANVPCMLDEMYGSKSLTTGKLQLSGNPTSTLDTRVSSSFSIFSRKLYPATNGRTTVAIARNNLENTFALRNDNFGLTKFTPYEFNADPNDDLDVYDASCINELTGSEIQWGSSAVAEAISLGYGNYLTGIKIKNCNGPIYISNFTVDGGATSSNVSYGIYIENSNVNLRNCTVTRCRKAGLKAVNSQVTLLRAFGAYRNYDFDESNQRIGEPWLSKIKNRKHSGAQSAGISLDNSILNISSTYNYDLSAFSGSINEPYDFFNLLVSYKTAFGANGIPNPSYSNPIILSRNDIGLESVNSKIYGGRTELLGSALNNWYDATQIISELNTVCGFKLLNSYIDYSGRFMAYSNFVGLLAENSQLHLDSFNFQYNQKEAIKLVKSALSYNKDTYSHYMDSHPVASQQANSHIQSLFNNGTHLYLENSTYEPTQTSAMPSVYGRFVASGAWGIEQDLTNQDYVLPSIIVKDNSKLDLVHPTIEIPDAFTDTANATYGAAISVTNNSEAIIRGSKSFVSKVFGPSTHALQRDKAGLYAGNNSKIKIHGPTVLARFGIDVLCDKGSILEITPPRDRNGALEVSAYSLDDPGNHTSVELHSTRACLVADNNSILKFEDLGDYKLNWNQGSYGSSIVLSSLDYATDNQALYTSAGSLQFYPNPNDADDYPPGIENPTIGVYSVSAMNTNANNKNYFFIDVESTSDDFSGITVGGMCVRALNKSNVEVNNVNFPCGWWNSSGTIYDANGTLESAVYCSRLFIWNIADNSLLNAKYLSVSSLHPRDAGYYGPSGSWGMSAAPATTPDTSSLSVLDYYGRATDNAFGKSSQENYGPFRLYFSIDPACNWLLTSALDLSGYAPQIYSQGYQFSSNLVAPGTVSAQYTSLLQKNAGVLQPSGFYYASSMVFSPFTCKAILEDSAANTFANAKHNSVGKSGLAKVVNIYYPFTGSYGGDSADGDTKAYGAGVRSVNNFDLKKTN